MLNMKEVNTQTLGGTNYEGGLGGQERKKWTDEDKRLSFSKL